MDDFVCPLAGNRVRVSKTNRMFVAGTLSGTPLFAFQNILRED
jgi:hypothetical protein